MRPGLPAGAFPRCHEYASRVLIYKLLSISVVLFDTRSTSAAGQATRGGIVVKSRRWLARTTLLAGAGLLVLALAAVAFAAPQRAGKTGGAVVVGRSTGIDYIDSPLDHPSSGWGGH